MFPKENENMGKFFFYFVIDFSAQLMLENYTSFFLCTTSEVADGRALMEIL